jgi:hypothetical protein
MDRGRSTLIGRVYSTLPRLETPKFAIGVALCQPYFVLQEITGNLPHHTVIMWWNFTMTV